MTIEERQKEAWLAYMSADKYKAEYYLFKYLKLLTKEDLAELMQGFESTHGYLIQK
jgi:hypothetical protein